MTAHPNLVVRLDPRQRFAALIDCINREHADARVCVISGDLTDDGTVGSYLSLQNALQTLQIPYLLTLGNHDNRTAFCEVFGNAHNNADGFAQQVMDIDDTRIILLDTLDDSRPDIGKLCPDRLAWFDECMSQGDDKNTVLFMHHPPRSIGTASFDAMMLNEPEVFWNVVGKHQNLRHIAFGHTHLDVTGLWDRLSFSCNSGPCHHIALDLANPVITFVDTLPRFDVLLIDGPSVIAHQTCVFPKHLRLAREYPTADGKGRFDYSVREQSVDEL